MAMVETEQAHRIESEEKILAATIRDTRRGHWIGMILAVLSIAAAVVAVYLQAHASVSIALVVLPLVALVNAVMKNKSNGK